MVDAATANTNLFFYLVMKAIMGIIMGLGLLSLVPIFFLAGSVHEAERWQVSELVELTPEMKAAAEQVVYDHDEGKTACVFIREGVMSFVSANMVLCVYDRRNDLLGKCIYGYFSIEILEWGNRKMAILVRRRGSTDPKADRLERQYVESWLQRNPKIDKYEIRYVN